jgi:hypothetical protein
MTLIITAMSPYRVIQVSDRRLTLPGGKLHDDKANKAVTVRCDDAYFSVAYTGLARVRDKRTRTWISTDKWIANSLHDLMQQSGLGTAIELYRAFGAYAEETLCFTPAPLTRKATTFVFAGFFVRNWATAFVGILSNMRTTEAGNIKVVRDFDTQQVWSPSPAMPYNELELFVDGMVPAMASRDATAKAIHRRAGVVKRKLEREQRDSGNRDDDAIAKELVKVVRMTNRHPEHGKYIGRDCMTVVINSETPTMTTHTYMEDSVEHDWPWMVSRDMVIGGWYSLITEDGVDTFPRI